MTEEEKMDLPGASPEVREDAHAVTSGGSGAERIPEVELERAREDLCQRIGWALLKALCNGPYTVADVAARLGRSARYVRRKLLNPRSLSLRDVGEFAYALDCEIAFSVVDRETGERFGPAGPVRAPWWTQIANDNDRGSLVSRAAIDWAVWNVRRAA